MFFINEKYDSLDNIESLSEEIKVYQEIIDYCGSKIYDYDKKEELDKDEKEKISLYKNEKEKALKEQLQIYINNKDLNLQVSILEELISNTEIEKDKINYLNQIVKIYKSSKIKNYIVAVDYQLKIVKNSNKPTDYFELIELYSLLNDIENKQKYQVETKELYNKLIIANESNTTLVNTYRIKILELLIALDDKIQIEQVYLEIIKRDNTNSLQYSEKLAYFYSNISLEYAKAIKQFEKLIFLNNKDEIKYLKEISSLFLKVPNIQDSINTYYELIKKDAINEEYYLTEINNLYIEKVKDYEKVLEIYYTLESKFDKNYYKEKIAGFHLEYTKDYYKAITLYKELSMSNFSEKSRYLEKIASIYEENIKKYDDAINEYIELININPNNKEIYQRSIIRLYWNDKKDIDKTIEKIEEFFGNTPIDEEIKLILEDAKNIKEKDELKVKSNIGDNFEETEKEFKNSSLIYMFIIINIVLLLIILNKDIFFKDKVVLNLTDNNTSKNVKDNNVTRK